MGKAVCGYFVAGQTERPKWNLSWAVIPSILSYVRRGHWSRSVAMSILMCSSVPMLIPFLLLRSPRSSWQQRRSHGDGDGGGVRSHRTRNAHVGVLVVVLVFTLVTLALLIRVRAFFLALPDGTAHCCWRSCCRGLVTLWTKG